MHRYCFPIERKLNDKTVYKYYRSLRAPKAAVLKLLPVSVSALSLSGSHETLYRLIKGQHTNSKSNANPLLCD